VAVSPTGPEAGDVFVTNVSSGTVSVINPTTDTVIATIGVGGAPFGVAVSPIGPEAGDVFVVNTGNNTVSVIS
jgi:YVTN family beta-propeller protein